MIRWQTFSRKTPLQRVLLCCRLLAFGYYNCGFGKYERGASRLVLIASSSRAQALGDEPELRLFSYQHVFLSRRVAHGLLSRWMLTVARNRSS